MPAMSQKSYEFMTKYMDDLGCIYRREDMTPLEKLEFFRRLMDRSSCYIQAIVIELMENRSLSVEEALRIDGAWRAEGNK